MTFGKKGRAAGFDLKNFGELDQVEANELVHMSLDAGINFFDTAETYSGGESERILGKALGNKRSEVIIATKASGRLALSTGNQISHTRKRIFEAVEGSLLRLGTDYIDLYQLHTRDVYTPMEETLRALEDMVRSGKVRYIGCSNLMSWEVMKALSIAEKRSYTRMESLQAYYSLVGRELEREIIPLINDQKLGLLVWSPLAGGVLTDKFAFMKRPGDARYTHYQPPLVPPVDHNNIQAVYETLRVIAGKHQATIAQISIAWLLHQKAVTSVLIGAKKSDQLTDNLRAVDIDLSKEELQELETISKLKLEYPQWIQPFNASGLWREK